MKVFVVDSHAIYRRGLVASLELLDRVESVAQAGSVGDATRDAALSSADVVIVDTTIAGGREFVAATSKTTDANVIACTSDGDLDSVIGAVEAGAVGYLRKDTLTQDILQAGVNAAEVGASVVAPDMLSRMVGRVGQTAGPAVPAGRGKHPLTDREQRVLTLIADGLPTREVAARLSYSERTVKNALHDIVTKLNARSRSQAVAYAVRDGLI